MKHSLVCILLIAVLCLTSCQNTALTSPTEQWVSNCKAVNYALQTANYPQMVQYPSGDSESDSGWEDAYEKWSQQRRERYQNYIKDSAANCFFAKSASCFLTEKNGKNKIYSPINIYFALCMLAEVTEGDTRAEILSALESKDIETLRKTANGIWNDNYCDDGLMTTRFANSFWLNHKILYKEATLKQLAENYYASSFSGNMEDKFYTLALRDWLNEQTGGLLKEQAENLEFTPDTVMALVSTLYFKGKWSNEFDNEYTKADTFHAPNGDVTCDFMNQFQEGEYYIGQDFGAVNMPMEDGAGMWLILPNEGKSPEDLMADGQVTEFLSTADNRNSKKSALLNLKVPKFDVSADLEFSEQLKQMGIQKVFGGGDFSPITDDVSDIYLAQAQHATRVKIDEEGCEAAAFTVLVDKCRGLPEEEIDFVLDRPFIFAITSDSGCVLFTGIVNQP